MIGKIKKLLCFLIISIFIIGFGGEVVKAESITVKDIKWLGDYKTAKYAKFIVDRNGVTRYAYCLNAELDNPPIGALLTQINDSASGISKYQKMRIINTLLAAGYPNYDLYYNNGQKMSDDDAFYVTQAAVWFAIYGDAGTYRTFTANFHKKMVDSTVYGSLYDKYGNAYNKLINAGNTYSGEEPTISLSSTTGSLDKSMEEMVIENNKILISKNEFEVFVEGIEGNYIVKVNGENAYITSEDGSANYGTEKEFSLNDTFKIAIDVPDEGNNDVSADFTVTTKNGADRYDLYYYLGANSTGIQAVTMLIPYTTNPISVDYSVVGKSEGNFTIKAAKLDSEDNYVYGAEIDVYDENDKLVTNFISGEEPVELSLPAGNYYLKEKFVLGGYYVNHDKIEFTVGNDGKLTSGGEVVEYVSIVNDIARLMVKKTDENGKPLAGVTFIVYDHWQYEGMNPKYLCGMTDENGLLTKESDFCKTIDLSFYGNSAIPISSDGIYKIDDFDTITHIMIKELDAPYGYVVDENEYQVSFSSYSGEGFFMGRGSDTQVLYNEKYNANVIEFSFDNYRYIDISKTDATGTSELEGAELTIYRKNEDGSKGDFKDNWLSTTEPHKFLNIEKNVRYYLVEEFAPKGFVKFSGMIEFELVDDKGTIKTYDPETGKEISSYSESKLVLPNEPTKVHISKTDMVTGEEVPGAEIKLCSAEEYEKNGVDCKPSKEEWSWTSSNKPQYIEMLPVGDYYLIETVAPEGYVRQTNAVKFSVKEETGIQQVEFTNEPTKVTVEKKDYKTGKPISNVTFQIINVETNEVVREWVSDNLDEGHIEYAIPMGKYKLVETVYPEGYKEGMIVDGIVTSEYEFEITEDVSEITITVYNEALTDVPSTGISTINLFAIGGLMVFIGYQVIRIYRRRVIS